jgi:HAD superfamily hydrolase (TIGR01549 family)
VNDFAHMREVLGMPKNADILAVLKKACEPEKQRLTKKLDELEEFYARKASPALGVQRLIKTLATEGCKLGIFTRNTKDMAILSLEAIGVGQYFDHESIIGRDEAPHKPDPQGLFVLLNQWQSNIDDSVMVGDFKYDLAAGKAAGITTIHIYNDEQRWPDLTDYSYGNLLELVDVLK